MCLDLAQIPFDKLSEIQQKVGMRVFHQTLRGSEKKKAATKGSQRTNRSYDDDSEDDDMSEEDTSDEEEQQSKSKVNKLRDAMNRGKEQRKIIQRRNDKNK